MKELLQIKKGMLKVMILSILLLLLPTVMLLAQIQPPDPGGDPGVPLDGGLSILLAAGIGYGAKKVHEARKKGKQKSIEETNSF